MDARERHSICSPRHYPRPLQKRRGGREPGNIRRKAVDFHRLVLAVPIGFQNETTCTHDILSTKQKIVNLKMNL